MFDVLNDMLSTSPHTQALELFCRKSLRECKMERIRLRKSVNGILSVSHSQNKFP
jgi:hypothetical protein